MSQVVYKQLKLEFRFLKFFFLMFFYLDSNIKQTTLQHNNVFVNKHMTWFKCVYIHTRTLEIGLCKFVNNFIRYQIVICNLLVIIHFKNDI